MAVVTNGSPAEAHVDAHADTHSDARTQAHADAHTESPQVASWVFLGTGTSSQVPTIGCLTDARTPCRVCPSALHPATSKNRRRNTSAIATLTNGKTLLVDCGKSFFDAALQLWPRARLRQIDALLLTHAHADAMLGLDDLRGWTLDGFVQRTVDVYLSQATYDQVCQVFAYCVDATKATGGGDIPAFCWHVVAEDSSFFVEPCGLRVHTLPVAHGCYFDAARTPFVCLGFQIGAVSYISDASHVPAATRRKMQRLQAAYAGHGVLVLDALKYSPHASHMSIPEALAFVNGLDVAPAKTFLLDFTHDVDHYALEHSLRQSQTLDIAPAYDGLQLVFDPRDASIVREVDLLAERRWLSVREQDGRTPDDDRDVPRVV